MNLSEKLAPAVRGFQLEDRPQQNQMADAVASALQDGGVLLVEAGTGVGKSFAYLLPALEHALREGGPVVVSTHTLNLQEQLFEKDLPIVQRALEAQGLGPARVALLKGRGQYLSRRRLKLAMSANLQTDFAGETDALEKINERSQRDFEGTWSRLGTGIPAEVWSEVRSDPFHCLGARCETFESCFYHGARRRAYDAHLILVNHALLLSDLALKMEQETGVLPPYQALIVDEAHHLPALASDHLAQGVSYAEFLGLSRRLLHGAGPDDKKAKGILTLAPAEGAGAAVTDLLAEAERFFLEVGESLEPQGSNRGGPPRSVLLPDPAPDASGLAGSLQKLEGVLRRAEASATSDEVRLEVEGSREEIRDILRRLSVVLERGWDEEACYVVDPDLAAFRRGIPRAGAVRAVPFEPSGLLRESLVSSLKTVVFTSATLSVAGDFGYFKRALGADEHPGVRELSLGSPFDFKRQVTLFLPRSMPHPRREEEAWMAQAVEYIRASLKNSHGKAFVLFTSFKALKRAAEAVRPDLDKMGITLLVQGEEGWDRTRLLNVFREDVNSVLFGVNSFWEGVDVPGEALSNLILTKLPFQVPEGPVVEARHKRLKERGLEPFSAESLPEACLRLKQGFGRLIRSATDVGTVTILDPRVTTERWGQAFLKALPECETVFLAGPGRPEAPSDPTSSKPKKASSAPKKR